jgi:glutathione S-transferase
MIDLYHHGMSVCAAKVRFALGEKQIAWESRYVDIHKGDQFAPDYVKLNPKAVVPTLVHDGHVRLFGVGLRADGHIFARGHRHRASHQSRDTRD